MGGNKDSHGSAVVDKELVKKLSSGVYPPIFHKFRSIGLYVIRFFKNCQWVYVIVDERIPVEAKTKKPIFGHCENPNELWVALIEKAYAKLHGCYENLISGYVDEGLQELTGFLPERIFLRDDKTGLFPHKRVVELCDPQADSVANSLWRFLQQRKRDGCLLGCSIASERGKVGELLIDGQPSGLILNHAYGINDLVELEKSTGDTWEDEEPIRLLRLRNPWGKTEWRGAWSDQSPEQL